MGRGVAPAWKGGRKGELQRCQQPDRGVFVAKKREERWKGASVRPQSGVNVPQSEHAEIKFNEWGKGKVVKWVEKRLEETRRAREERLGVSIASEKERDENSAPSRMETGSVCSDE